MKIMAFNGLIRAKKTGTPSPCSSTRCEEPPPVRAETELVQLYDLDFSGCTISCFSCRKRNRKADGVCAVQDDLTDVLDRVRQADALIIGNSPCTTAAGPPPPGPCWSAFVSRTAVYANAKAPRSLFPRRQHRHGLHHERTRR